MAGTDPKSKAACPSCQAHFVIPDGMVGKKAKCPKCGQPFIITKDESPPIRPQPRSTQAVATPTVPSQPASRPPTPAPVAPIAKTGRPSSNAATRTVTLSWWATTLGIPTLALVLGYFAGREHLKYQMRSALADFGKNIAEGVKAAANEAIANPSADAAAAAVIPADEPVAPIPQIPRVTIGQTYDAGQFTVQVLGAKIAPTRLRDLRESSYNSSDIYLMVSMQFHNKDERRLLRFFANKPFQSPMFRMRDDVGNVVRPMGFGINTKVVGAIQNMDELRPESSLQHIEVFEVPLPKTQSLTLLIDLGCFQGDGEIEVEIPYKAVEWAQP